MTNTRENLAISLHIPSNDGYKMEGLYTPAQAQERISELTSQGVRPTIIGVMDQPLAWDYAIVSALEDIRDQQLNEGN